MTSSRYLTDFDIMICMRGASEPVTPHSSSTESGAEEDEHPSRSPGTHDHKRLRTRYPSWRSEQCSSATRSSKETFKNSQEQEGIERLGHFDEHGRVPLAEQERPLGVERPAGPIRSDVEGKNLTGRAEANGDKELNQPDATNREVRDERGAFVKKGKRAKKVTVSYHRVNIYGP